MKTLRSAPVALLALVVAAVALVGSACSAVDPVALQVNDWQLSSSTFESRLNDFADAYTAAEGELAADQALRGGRSGDVWSTTFTSQLLSDQLALHLAEMAVDERGLEVTDDDRSAARSLLEQRFTGSSGDSVFGELSESYQDNLIDGLAAQLVLQDDLLRTATTDEALRRIYEESGSGEEQACVSHILVLAGDPDGQTTPSDEDYATALSEIEDVKAELDGGADFATVAQESSQDGSAAEGGDLGCAARNSYVEGFEEAVWSQPVGEVGEPVKTIYGYHLVLVRSREVPTFEDVKDELAQQVSQNGQQLVQAELVRLARDAEITVDGRYGTFDPETASVVPPAGAQAEATATPSIEQLLSGQ